MTWRSVVLAIALVGVPTIAAAQAHRDHPASPQKEATEAVSPGGADGAMACPMMAQHAMPMGAMRGMPSRGEDRGGHAGMGRSAMGVMGMMPMAEFDGDPKAQARWMQLRGEMMKAMGDILIRHGRELESAK